jgi:hypothetical protein
MTTSNGRTFVEYVDDEGGEISLPGYLDATPSIVRPGDTFSILAEHADEVLAAARFVETDVPADPLERMTKAELAEQLGSRVDPNDYTKPQLVDLVRDRARMFPPVPGESADPLEAEVPVVGQLEDSDPEGDPPPGDDAAGDGDDHGTESGA